MQDENEQRSLVERIEKLEEDSHPPIGLCEFEGFKELEQRISLIEDWIKCTQRKS